MSGERERMGDARRVTEGGKSRWVFEDEAEGAAGSVDVAAHRSFMESLGRAAIDRGFMPNLRDLDLLRPAPKPAPAQDSAATTSQDSAKSKGAPPAPAPGEEESDGPPAAPTPAPAAAPAQVPVEMPAAGGAAASTFAPGWLTETRERLRSVQSNLDDVNARIASVNGLSSALAHKLSGNHAPLCAAAGRHACFTAQDAAGACFSEASQASLAAGPGSALQHEGLLEGLRAPPAGGSGALRVALAFCAVVQRAADGGGSFTLRVELFLREPKETLCSFTIAAEDAAAGVRWDWPRPSPPVTHGEWPEPRTAAVDLPQRLARHLPGLCARVVLTPEGDPPRACHVLYRAGVFQLPTHDSIVVGAPRPQKCRLTLRDPLDAAVVEIAAAPFAGEAILQLTLEDAGEEGCRTHHFPVEAYGASRWAGAFTPTATDYDWRLHGAGSPKALQVPLDGAAAPHRVRVVASDAERRSYDARRFRESGGGDAYPIKLDVEATLRRMPQEMRFGEAASGAFFADAAELRRRRGRVYARVDLPADFCKRGDSILLTASLGRSHEGAAAWHGRGAESGADSPQETGAPPEGLRVFLFRGGVLADAAPALHDGRAQPGRPGCYLKPPAHAVGRLECYRDIPPQCLPPWFLAADEAGRCAVLVRGEDASYGAKSLSFVVECAAADGVTVACSFLREEELLSPLERARLRIYESALRGVNGARISSGDRAEAPEERRGKAFTYGEVDYCAFKALLEQHALKAIGRAHGGGLVFADLGSGTGKAVLCAAIGCGFARALGIELVPGLFQGAATALRQLHGEIRSALPAEAGAWHLQQTEDRCALERGGADGGGALRFGSVEVVRGSFLEVDWWSRADVVYASSICFPDELIDAIRERAERMRPGALFVTLKRFNSEHFDTAWAGSCRMTWGRNMVFVLRRK